MGGFQKINPSEEMRVKLGNPNVFGVKQDAVPDLPPLRQDWPLHFLYTSYARIRVNSATITRNVQLYTATRQLGRYKGKPPMLRVMQFAPIPT